jgi:hypothetical protein
VRKKHYYFAEKVRLISLSKQGGRCTGSASRRDLPSRRQAFCSNIVVLPKCAQLKWDSGKINNDQFPPLTAWADQRIAVF